MMHAELLSRLQAADIRADVYHSGGGLPNERLCLDQDDDEWIVYYSERGERTGLRHFVDEQSANEYFFETLDRMPEAHSQGQQR